MSEKYGQFTTFRTQPGKADELIGLLVQATQAMRGLKHCLSYVVSTDSAEDNCVRVFEVWDAKTAHAASLQDPRAVDLIKQALPLLAGRPESIDLKVVAGLD